MSKKPETLEQIMAMVNQHTQSAISTKKQLESKKLMPNMRRLLESDLDNFEHSLQHWLSRLRNHLKSSKERLLEAHYQLCTDQWTAAISGDVHEVAKIQTELKRVNFELKALNLLITVQELSITVKTQKAA